MQKIHFSIFITVPKERVWATMLDLEMYKEWTKAFSPGSSFKGKWEEGEKMLFIGPDPQTGEEGGMVSYIKEFKPHEFISIMHVGIFKNGVEDTESVEAKKWSPSYENYTFKEIGTGTELSIDMEVPEEYATMFDTTWPTALQALKDLAERP